MAQIGRLGLAVGLTLLISGCAGDARITPGMGTGPIPNYDAIMHVADATRDAGDVNGALVLYRKATMAAPTRPEPEIAIGKCLLDLGRVDESIDAYRDAVASSKNGTEALRGLANAYLAARRPDLAIQPLETASTQDPSNAKLLGTLGVAADLSGDHRKAQTFYSRGMAIDAMNDGLVNNLALSMALSGDYPQAISTLKPIADSPRSTARERQTLSLIYGLSGNRDVAGRYAKMDLDDESVSHNLAYFDTLRGLPADARDRAVIAASWTPPRQGATTGITN